MEQAEANAELEMPALMKKEMEDASQIRRKGGEQGPTQAHKISTGTSLSPLRQRRLQQTATARRSRESEQTRPRMFPYPAASHVTRMEIPAHRQTQHPRQANDVLEHLLAEATHADVGLNVANRPTVSRAQTSVPGPAVVIHRASSRASWNISTCRQLDHVPYLCRTKSESALEGADTGVTSGRWWFLMT